jgi:hypothetical protein
MGYLWGLEETQAIDVDPEQLKRRSSWRHERSSNGGWTTGRS